MTILYKKLLVSLQKWKLFGHFQQLCKVLQKCWCKVRLLIESNKIHHFSSMKMISKIVSIFKIFCLNLFSTIAHFFYNCFTIELMHSKLSTLIVITFFLKKRWLYFNRNRDNKRKWIFRGTFSYHYSPYPNNLIPRGRKLVSL